MDGGAIKGQRLVAVETCRSTAPGMANTKWEKLSEKYEFVSNIPLTGNSKAQVIY